MADPSTRTAETVPRRAGHSVVWSPEFLTYRLSDSHPMNPVRLRLTMALATMLGVVRGVELEPPSPVGDADLLRVHTRAYIDVVKQTSAQAGLRGGAAVPGSVSLVHGLGSDDNPVFPRMHEASAIVAGGTLAAARQIASGRATRAVSIAGGMHHAMANFAAGFCVYNDCAIAINWLLENGFDRIAYIDIDVHHGDGVQKAFIADPRVLTVSLHQHPATLWPGTGWASEVGFGAAEGTSVNLPLLPGTTDALWLRAFHAVVPGAVKAFRPQLIVTQCGVDTHREDPLADLALTVDGHRAAFRALRELADTYAEGRWLAVGGGGYGLVRVVPRSWAHLIATVLDRDVDPATPVPQAWRDLAAELGGGAEPPASMGEGGEVAFAPWDGFVRGSTTGPAGPERELARVDAAIAETRHAVYPLLGLDPEDPRD